MHDEKTQSLLQERIRFAARSLDGLKAPALSYAVATTDGTAVVGAIGTSDLARDRDASPGDQYPWFSMTKIATATTVVRLAHSGDIDLDALVGTYLPGYRALSNGHPTVRQLLTHTAGLGNPLPIRWVRPEGQPVDRELLARIARKHGRPRRSPGGRAAYSNIGYLLAGQVIEAVTGQSVEEAIGELVLRPLGMDRTGFAAAPERPRATGYVGGPRLLDPLLRAVLPRGVAGPRVGHHPSLNPFVVEGAAYGGLVGPASDAARLAAAHLPAPVDDTDAQSPLGDLGEMRLIRHPGRPFDHGIGWFRKPADANRSPTFVEHYGTGVGFWNAMRIYPALGIAVVGMTNATSRWPYDAFFTAVVDAVRTEVH